MDRSSTRADNNDDATSPTDAGVMSRSLPNRNYVFVFTTMTRKNKYHIIYQKNLTLMSYVLSECICDMISCGNSFPSQKRKKSRDSNSSFFSSFLLAIWTALKMLGYRTYHFKEIHKPENLRDKHLLCWREAFYAKLYGSGKPYSHEDFYKLLQRYDVS